jgi:hypothetical protein
MFEYDPKFPEIVTNTREMQGTISYILRDYPGLQPGYCIFSYA